MSYCGVTYCREDPCSDLSHRRGHPAYESTPPSTSNFYSLSPPVKYLIQQGIWSLYEAIDRTDTYILIAGNAIKRLDARGAPIEVIFLNIEDPGDRIKLSGMLGATVRLQGDFSNYVTRPEQLRRFAAEKREEATRRARVAKFL